MIPLTPNDLPVGKPLPWSLLDDEGNLMLGCGSVIPDRRDLALMFRHGAVCRQDAESDPQAVDHVPAGPLGLPVGTLLHVKIPGESTRAAASRLIGFVEQGFFMTWPQLDGRELALLAGEPLLLHGFSGQTIHRFTSTVTAICRSPFRYLVLSVPEETHQTPIRKAARVPTRLAAYLLPADPASHSDGSDDSVDAIVLPDAGKVSREVARGAARLAMLSDLSTGGALVQTTSPAPPPGSRIRLHFRLRTAALDSEITIDAWARATQSEQEDVEYPAFGVVFDVLGERELTLLQCFIYEHLLAGARMPV